MLLPSFFSRENLTCWLSLSTLIKALRTVMELSREKHGRSISLCEGHLDCQCRLGAWSSLLSRCVFFPFFLAVSSARLIWSQGRFLDGRRRRRKQRHGHRLIAGVSIPSSPLPSQCRNLTTAPIPSVTAPPTIVSRTTDFGGGRASLSHV
jgi:hypothetical protein